MQNKGLTINSIQIVRDVKDWRHAIQLGVQPLLDRNCVKESYAEAITKNMERYGSSFLVSPYVVLPHARPEQGVLQNAISVLLSKKPFYFNDRNKPMKLMIVLAPVDSSSHLMLLRKVSMVLHDQDVLTKILESETKEKISRLFTGEENVKCEVK